jgi:hypothetical protein
MSLNPYFNNYSGVYDEQRLVEDLIVESIQIMGTDSYYVPNDNIMHRDLIYGEDPLKKFDSAYPIEIYPSNVLEYGGQKEFFSKFGLEIRNTMTVIMSRRAFDRWVTQEIEIMRPREGDLLYIPVLNGKGELYEIKFVNQNKDMMTLGRRIPYFYELELEKFKYSHETIDTGIPEIDIVQREEAYAQEFTLTNIVGAFIDTEIVYINPQGGLANSTFTAVVSSYNNYSGTIVLNKLDGPSNVGDILRGNSSAASGTISYTDEHKHAQIHAQTYDNEEINNESKIIVDESETDPLGSIGNITY